MKTCSIDACDGKYYGRGWCSKHYSRWKKSGDPLFVEQIRGDDRARFDSYVNRSGPTKKHMSSACWIWTGYLDAGGYGRIRINGKVLAHRHAYERFVGPIPDDKPHVLHHCDNPACVRPEHLYAGDNDDNIRDKVERNRQSKLKGEAHPGAKLTWLQVLEIRTATGVQKAVANQYGITNSTVSRIKSRKKWGWLPEDGDWTCSTNDPYPETINEADLEFEQPITEPRSERP